MEMRTIKLVTIMTILAASALPTIAQEYVLLLKQSPVEAGTLDRVPGDGGIVTVTATPKDGYRFSGWIGDVANAGLQTTTISTDGPKLVIATYTRDDYENGASIGSGGASSSNFGGFAPSVVVGVAASAPGGSNYSGGGYTYPDVNEEDFNPDIPVPNETIPEPTTIALFALVGLKLLRKRN